MTPIDGYILTALTSLLVGYLLTYLKPKAKIYYWSPHFFSFCLHNENNLKIQTDSLTVQNLGRESAKDIEIILSYKPDHFQFQPSIYFDIKENTDGFIINIPRLEPKEHVILQLLHYKNVPPQLQTIRFNSGIAKQLPFQISRIIPKWLCAMAWILIFAGIYFLTSKLFTLISLLIKVPDFS